MAKRSATDPSSDPLANAKTPRFSEKRDVSSVDDIGEFEDAWEDELESDEDVVDGDPPDGTSNSTNDPVFHSLVTYPVILFYQEWTLMKFSQLSKNQRSNHAPWRRSYLARILWQKTKY